MLTPGTLIERYRIQRRIGYGALGALYEAEDPVLQRLVAIRILVQEAQDPTRAARLQRELRLAARLKHPNIATIHEFGTYESNPYIVSEYVQGETLADVIARKSPSVSLADKLRWMEELCAGAAYAHAEGVIHRNIKPSNLMIDRTAHLKILDFGLAGLVDVLTTQTGAVMVTPRYLAPEQIRGGESDQRADLFAVGAVCYELVSSTKAFTGDTVQDVFHHILSSNPVPLGTLVPDAHHDVIAVIDRALRKDPAERFPDADTMREALERARATLERDRNDSLGGGDDFGDERKTRARRLETPPAVESFSGLAEPVLGVNDGKPLARPRDDVQFTVYRPNVVPPGQWKTMLAFMHLADRPPDAPRELPSPRERVGIIAHQLLGAEASQFGHVTADGRQGVPRESEVSFVPLVAGIEFKPPHRTFRWVHDLHQESFQLRASAALDGRVAVGQLSVFLGVVLLAQVDLSIAVETSPQNKERVETTSAVPFRKIFASYSHKDTEIVRQFEVFVESLGDRYLRDVRDLRAGENWNERLLTLIEQADVFQLFWSTNAMRSPSVRKEWEHALSLNRSMFVRPTYWETPLPESPNEGLPPESLRRLHFHHFAMSSVVTPPPDARRVVRESLARQRAAQIAALVKRGRAALGRSELDVAHDSCLQALAIDDRHPDALALEASVNRAREREQHVQAILSEARRMIEAHSHSAALAKLEEARGLDPAAPEVERLERALRDARQRAEEQEAEAMRRADKAAYAPDEAVASAPAVPATRLPGAQPPTEVGIGAPPAAAPPKMILVAAFTVAVVVIAVLVLLLVTG